MARPSTVDSDAVVAYVRQGFIPADAARHFGISRMRVSQIIAERAPDLSHAGPPQTFEPTPDQQAMIAKTEAAMASAKTRVEAARALKLTVSGLNSRLRRYGIADTLTRSDRDERLYAATVAALDAAPTKKEAAKSLGLTVSGLNSRIERWGINKTEEVP
ncbi:hypothetical protein MARCHEWKA_04180 [Brevundimonas phage vB_BpoS-Marchewka]|uniref:DNA binding HTH domain-containing protein n=1 Tax=Brevundimonas phage vB_BpoS-Marchewka TaxID=2948604 RepID=A0A9E7N4T0_9CAUD|nr:hypothetical protein MARCHEWKA_04180 [Brevundimonas phage vB_BpoS-Marchewka]